MKIRSDKGVTKMLIDCGNYFHEKAFNEVCEALEQGETVRVYIDCIGHTRNNYEQETYKEKLIDKYGSKLNVKCSNGACSYSYEYKLE